MHPRIRTGSLDIVRIVAAVGVLLFHATTVLGADTGPLQGVVGSLNLGVMAFFSLSGYLVTRPFLTGSITPTEHLVRRTSRILPAYVVAVLGGWALLGWLDPMLGGVAWTLLIELAFYAVLPFVTAAMLAIGHRPSTHPIALLLTFGAVSLAACAAVLGTGGRSSAVAGSLPPLWFWAFVPGMMVAWLQTWSPGIMARLAAPPVLVLGVVVCGSVLVAPTGVLGPVDLGRMVVMAMATALLIPGLLRTAVPRRSGMSLAVAGRTLSYPVYLWHPAVILGLTHVGVRGWPAVAATIALTLVAAVLSWRLVEHPGLALADRLLARGASVAEPLALPERSLAVAARL